MKCTTTPASYALRLAFFIAEEAKLEQMPEGIQPGKTQIFVDSYSGKAGAVQGYETVQDGAFRQLETPRTSRRPCMHVSSTTRSLISVDPSVIYSSTPLRC